MTEDEQCPGCRNVAWDQTNEGDRSDPQCIVCGYIDRVGGAVLRLRRVLRTEHGYAIPHIDDVRTLLDAYEKTVAS